MPDVIYELPEQMKEILKDDAQYYWQLPVRRGQDEIANIFKAIDGRAWIAGSFAAYMCAAVSTPIEPADIDIFVSPAADYDAVVKDVCDVLVRPTLTDVNDLVTTYGQRDGRPVQIVKGNPGWGIMPWHCLASFDLDVCRACLTSLDYVSCHVNAGDPYHGKILQINNPLKTLKRVVKYNARGVQFEDSELVKILKAWEAMTPERRKTIMDEIEAESATDFAYYDDEYYDAE